VIYAHPAGHPWKICAETRAPRGAWERPAVGSGRSGEQPFPDPSELVEIDVPSATPAAGLTELSTLAGGFAAYALWQLSQAIYGTATDGRKTNARLSSLARCLGYVVLCGTAISVLTGSSNTARISNPASPPG
jgi:hypothetical protein